jgi:hypothetical protein
MGFLWRAASTSIGVGTFDALVGTPGYCGARWGSVGMTDWLGNTALVVGKIGRVVGAGAV